ncbi:MAG: zinc-binding dehydrogenase, partial [Alphaproteobacteria bacterium]|nr:zinc-binding dehydrogenase [Alphaproteobacteria bacterium]
LIALAARQAGAAEITIFDLAAKPLAIAEQIGVDRALQLGGGDDPLKPFEAAKGSFDIAFEATGAAAALANLPRITRPGGTIIQIGMLPTGEVGLAVNLLMAKEIDYRGSFRFRDEYGMAVDFLTSGKVDVTPLITDSYAIDDADAAFATAADRERSIKVQLVF